MTLTTSLHAARRTHRDGFTLVELLVVIAIIAVLLSLTGAAITKTVESQKRGSTKANVYKLQQSLDVEYEQVVRKCEKERIPDEILRYADNDINRARAIWIAMNLRRQFPESFAEATVGISIQSPPGNTVYQLRPLTTFDPVQGVGSAATPPAPHPDERGALLYLILANKSVTGGGAMAMAADDLGLQRKVTIGGRQFTTFMDAWDNSLAFERWNQSAPAQQAPHLGSVNQFNPANTDPLDPRNLILGWADVQKRTDMNTFLKFNGQNRVITAYSAGKDKQYPSADDLLGFTLREFGK